MFANFCYLHVGFSICCSAYGKEVEPFHVYYHISRHEYMHWFIKSSYIMSVYFEFLLFQ